MTEDTGECTGDPDQKRAHTSGHKAHPPLAARSCLPAPTCDLGDAFQPRYRQQHDGALVGAHPEQTVTDQEAGDTQLLLACGGRGQREQQVLLGVAVRGPPTLRAWPLGLFS